MFPVLFITILDIFDKKISIIFLMLVLYHFVLHQMQLYTYATEVQ